MKYTDIIGTLCTKLRLFFHEVSFVISTLFPPLHEVLYTGHVKLFAKASELFMHAVLQLVIIHKTVFGVHPSGGQRDGSQSILNWNCREDDGEKIEGAGFCK